MRRNSDRGKGIAATSMAGPPGEARLGIPYGAATPEEGRQHVRELKARGVHFVKFWVDDREGTVPKLKPEVYRAIIDEAHKNGMETLAHLSRTSALADAKDLLKSGVDGFVHTVRDRDVDAEYIALVKAHPKVWTGPNIPGPAKRRRNQSPGGDPSGGDHRQPAAAAGRQKKGG